jgi:hypothetical protein
MAYKIISKILHAEFLLGFVSALESAPKKNGGIADVIRSEVCQIGFAFLISNREQALQANGVERTIVVFSVWK